jgi:hypothetical protein
MGWAMARTSVTIESFGLQTASVAAAFGLLELSGRLILPFLWHIPSGDLGARLANPLAHGTALAIDLVWVMVFVGVASLAFGAARRGDTPGAILAGLALISTVALSVRLAGLWLIAFQVAFATTAVMFTFAAVVRVGVAQRVQLLAIAIMVIAAQMIFISGELQALVPGSIGVPETGLGLLAEVALLVALIGAGLSALASAAASRAGWTWAVVASVLVAALVARDPASAAILSRWATGVTLSLPPLIYIAAASSATLAIVSWLPDRSSRHLAAAVVLILVAGVQPALVHHNLTLLFAAMLLATPPTYPVAAPAPARHAMPLRSVAINPVGGP